MRAVLVASRGDLEPAFNALLSMSDPSAVETPPPPPPRPRVSSRSDFTTSTPQSQLEADAMYARQLQEHFGAPMPRQQTAAGSARRQPPHQVPPQRRHPNDDSDDEYYNDKDEDKDRPSFFDEDLPVIKENIKKGFIETQTKVTGWFNEFKKRIDGESPETSPPASARTSAQYSRAGSRGQQRGGYDTTTRPSYDADPKVLSDDFTHLKMAPGSECMLPSPQLSPPSLTSPPTAAPRRPKANPNLFQPKASAGRKVSFEERPTTIDNDEDLYRPAASSARQPSPVGRNKWEPLKSVDPEPQHKDDPFSLEDSDDDEKDGLIKEGETARPGITGAQESGVTKKNP